MLKGDERENAKGRETIGMEKDGSFFGEREIEFKVVEEASEEGVFDFGAIEERDRVMQGEER